MRLPIGLMGTTRLTLAHTVVTVAAGVFGFLAVLGLREGVFAIVGATRLLGSGVFGPSKQGKLTPFPMAVDVDEANCPKPR